MIKKKIIFLTGTRADFGKLKSLIEICQEQFDVHIFATGMHMMVKYGYTVDEIIKCGYPNIFRYINHTSEESMDQTLAKTIDGFSNYVKSIEPDLIVVHGDRVESLAGAIVGALNNILVAHIEGGEVSGTIDELLRHSVSKLSHIHFVSNEIAKRRLLQMGEDEKSIFVIGSPDIDVMVSDKLPTLAAALERYEIPFKEYAIFMFHPVTTEIAELSKFTEDVIHAIIQSEDNFVVIYPNNDLGSSIILSKFEMLKVFSHRFKIFPSIRFEYFLTLLKNAKYIIGNSSAGIREAPHFGVPTINIGTRQKNRALNNDIINVGYSTNAIVESIRKAKNTVIRSEKLFGSGNSAELFLRVINRVDFWNNGTQKFFKDVYT